MKLQVTPSHRKEFSHFVYHSLERMLSPFTGLCNEIGYLKRSSVDPRLITIGGGLTGVHHLLNRPDPGKGGYHIGGVGYFHSETMIKTLAESLERYSQLLSEYTLSHTLEREFLTYKEMKSKYSQILSKENLHFFKPEQFSKKGFPFDPFSEEKPLTWVKVSLFMNDAHENIQKDIQKDIWVPASLLFIGYSSRRRDGEPWLLSAVTTGTAAHITESKATIGAISELIQVDAAMGHWYTNSPLYKIVLDDRVPFLKKFMEKTLNKKNGVIPTFYLLPGRGLPGFNIVCSFEREAPSVPRFAFGLGSDLSLEKALYKAFLEGYGVVGLARLNLFQDKYFLGKDLQALNQETIYDLDSNVSLYAAGHHTAFVREKFSKAKEILASSLPIDWTFEDDAACLHFLKEACSAAKLTLTHTHLTSKEAKEMGFYIERVWSPDLLPLCLPMAVPVSHLGFQAYGGVSHEYPHPYP